MGRDALETLGVLLLFLDTDFESVHKYAVRRVVGGQLHVEVELVHDKVRLCLQDLGQIDEILIDYEALLRLVVGQVRESLQDLGDEHVEHLVDLDQVLEEQVNHVRKKSSALAEVLMLVNGEDHSHQSIEVLIIHEDIAQVKLLDLF